MCGAWKQEQQTSVCWQQCHLNRIVESLVCARHVVGTFCEFSFNPPLSVVLIKYVLSVIIPVLSIRKLSLSNPR